MWSDIWLAARRLLRSRVFSAAAIVVLALGIGAGSAMYSILYTVFLKPLPYAQPQRLLSLSLPNASPQDGPQGGDVSLPNALAWRHRASDFSAIAFAQGEGVTLKLPETTELIEAQEVSRNLLSTLGVRPRLGRGFEPSDRQAAILTDAYWRSEFHQRRDILGAQIELDGKPYAIVGVLPAGVSFPLGDLTLMTPFVPTAQQLGWTAARSDLQVIARLRAGVTPGAAQTQLNAVQAALAREHPEAGGGEKTSARAFARSYREDLTGPVLPALLALAGATALVWLIACLSVTGLLLTRNAARRRELAVRAALGAGRARLAGQLLAECVLLALAAAVTGWVLASGGLALLRHSISANLPPGLDQFRLSGAALWGLAVLSTASVLLAGLGPALGGAKRAMHSAPREAVTARLRGILVITEIALALLLLTGASLLLRTLHNLRTISLGFSARNMITTPLKFPPGSFSRRDIVASFYTPLLERVRALPGVEAAALTTVVPLEQGYSAEMGFGHRGGFEASAAARITGPDYPHVFGIPMVRGRFFSASLDTTRTPEVMVVNQAFAEEYFPGQNVVGRSVEGLKIIGVIANVHWTAPGVPPGPAVFFSSTQVAPGRPLYGLASMFSDLAVRTRASAPATIPELRRLLHQLDPDVTGTNFETMHELINDSMASQIFAARLITLFSVIALIIALAGLYGLLAYTVAQRRRELGIRLALGASPAQVRRLVLGNAAALIGAGVGIGLAAALALAKVLASYLYGVAPRDPLTLAAAAALLSACALTAAWVPARRAGKVPVVETLRAE